MTRFEDLLAPPSDQRWLRWGVAAVWLTTGVFVLFPGYREIGGGYLARAGLPLWIMPVTCTFEVALGAFVALRPATRIDTLLQVALVGAFTLILAVVRPKLLVNPFGMLTKNVPFVAAAITALWLEREGWTRRSLGLLRAGMAAVWITEGLLPKILFQQREELSIVTDSGLSFGHPRAELAWLGVLELGSGIVALVLPPGRALRALLVLQLAGLVLLPIAVSVQLRSLWAHPFGPLTKNLPIIAGTCLLIRRCSSSS